AAGAGRRRRAPPRAPLAGRVQLPQGAGELLAVRPRGGHRGHQPAAVGGQGQAGHPRKAQVEVEVEGRLGTWLGGHAPNLGGRRRPRNGSVLTHRWGTLEQKFEWRGWGGGSAGGARSAGRG